ncbi:hypothetical protein GGS26DRAFT_4556 [Hypomontagnella submonticulosa]|nr:hypothetical protein GGS26DRAFT_4556 [Hypomontagnella submonticulosa]
MVSSQEDRATARGKGTASVVPGQYWDLIERDHPPVKRRTTHAKVRTGCTTCKSRRVKCDEKKPSCSRCERSGYLCAGYGDPNTRRGKPCAHTSEVSKRPMAFAGLQPKFLQPRTTDAVQKFPIDMLIPPSLTPGFLEDQDAPFFETFRFQIMVDMSTWCGADYWKSILREVMADECVRYAALALAAMMLAVERSSDLTGLLPASIMQCREGQAALRYYMKAISLCREQLRSGITKETIRTNLTATFFFAMMEMLQGNICTVDQIMINGTLLIRDALKAKPPNGRPGLVWDQELSVMKGGFDKLTIMWGLSPFFHGQKEIYTIISPTGEDTPVPDKDASILSIRVHWTQFQNDVGLFIMSVRCGKVVAPEYMESVILRKSRYLALLRRWMSLLDILIEREKNNSAFYPLGIMKATAITNTIFLSCFLDRSDVSYDLHLQSFLEVIHICQKFVPEKPPVHLRFTLDIDIFPVVSFTVTKCRDHKTRQLALKIFREMTHRQVFWNNQGMLKSLQALVDLENKGRDKKGFIPPSSRYFFVSSDWDFEKRQMMATFVAVTSIPTESGDFPTIRVPISF